MTLPSGAVWIHSVRNAHFNGIRWTIALPWIQRPPTPLDLAILAGFVVLVLAIVALAYLYKNGG